MPTAPLGSVEAVLMAKVCATLSVNCFVAVTDALSVTWTVNLKLPALEGGPVIAPVDELSVKPVGSDPMLTLQV